MVVLSRFSAAVLFVIVRLQLATGFSLQPTFSEVPGVKDRTLGGRAEFVCRVYSSNVKEFYWSFRGKKIENSDTFHIIVLNKRHIVLHITNITEDLAGHYCCSLDNGYRTWDRCGSLRVQFAPTITRQPKSANSYERENVRLTCTVKAHPAPTIAWLHNGGIICRRNTNKDCSISFTSFSTHVATLDIYGATRADAGTYQCNATNTLGLVYSEEAELSMEELTTEQSRVTTTRAYDTSFQTTVAGHSATQDSSTHLFEPSVTMDISGMIRNITVYTSVFSSADTEYHKNLSNPHSTILIVIFLGVTLLVLFVLFVICIRREDNYFNRPPRLSRLNAKRLVARPNKYDALQKLKYPTEKLDIIQELGEGVFGLVYKARAPGLLAPHETATVAVKMIRSDNQETPTKMGDFQREAELLSTFHHKNIIQLLGICIDGEKVNDARAITCLLFEYMDGGDLCAYLRKHGPNKEFFGATGRSSQAEFDISERAKLAMCTHIACGMQYLSERNFIHRDLATRNCLISAQDFNIKIADFGLSRQTYQSDYYKAGDTESLPIRWMSPEAILYGRYSTQSDVWAFGVTIWEIYAYALQPYFSLSNEEVICCVCQGKILSPPEAVPPWMFNLMQLCWQHSPENRPKFSTIHSVLQAIVLNDGRPPKDMEKIELDDNLQEERASRPVSVSECEEANLLPPPQGFRSDLPEIQESAAPNQVRQVLPPNIAETSPFNTNTRSIPLRRVVSDASGGQPIRPTLHRFSHGSMVHSYSGGLTPFAPSISASDKRSVV